MAKNIGIKGINPPKESCNDRNCPFHGDIKVRGRIFRGIVVSDKMTRSVVVEFDRIYKIPKYERYAKKRTRIKAHNPDCIKAKVNDRVVIIETRPISKTKNFVVVMKEENEK